MLKQQYRRLLIGSLLLLSLAILPVSIQAGNRALLELLRVLRDNGTISTEAYESLWKAAAEEDEPGVVNGELEAGDRRQVVPDSSTAKRQEPPESTAANAQVRMGRDGLAVESADGDFRLQLGGRLMVDAAWYDEDEAQLGDGTEVRSSRLSWSGALWKDWRFKSEVEFAEDGASLKSNYLRYAGFQPILLTAGSFKEPFGLERSTTLADISFMERAAVSSALAPGRGLGLGMHRAADNWTVGLGVFGEGDPGDGKDGHDRSDESWALSARTAFAPVHRTAHTLHVGMAASYRAFDDGRIRFRPRPESHITDVRFVDTGVITDVDDVLRYGFETAGVLGPFSLQAEYIAMRVRREGAGADLDFNGWYAYASYVLTGESRPYNARRGVFGRVEPGRPFGKSGLGAWEIGLRFSHLDLSDADAIGGEQDLLTLGLNWYPNLNLRFSTNYINVLDVDRPGSVFDREQPHILQIRGQVDF